MDNQLILLAENNARGEALTLPALKNVNIVNSVQQQDRLRRRVDIKA